MGRGRYARLVALATPGLRRSVVFYSVRGQRLRQPPFASLKWGAVDMPAAVALKARAAAGDSKVVAG